MALMKTSALAARTGAPRGAETSETIDPPQAARVQRRLKDRQLARQEKAAERIGAATEELTAGIAEASAAAEQLARALEQIASAADEAAGAAQQSQSAVTSLSANFTLARDSAALSQQQTGALDALLGEIGGGIETLVAAVEKNTGRQLQSVQDVSALERQAADIGEITGAVGDIAEQTNLLALNAAIEAARAGAHGRGFAVVADEVRAFAETSERSAAEVRSLAEAVRAEVRLVAGRIKDAAESATRDAAIGQEVVSSLGDIRRQMNALARGSQSILDAVIEAERGAREAQAGAGQVAVAAEEQSSAALQSQRAVQQQSASLEQSRRTAESLAQLAESLQAGSSDGAAIQVAAAAEELSATVQELSGAAGEILAAVEQISRGSHVQAAATQQASAAMAQIERAAGTTRAAAQRGVQLAETLRPLLLRNRDAVTGLAASVAAGLAQTQAMAGLVAALGTSSRQIDKIVERIALLAVQTNMLAVSGSVEAAREGEHGAGFAIVSADIRTLARDASENADRIRDVVRSLQEQIEAVRRNLTAIAAASEAEVARNQALVAHVVTVDAAIEAIRTGSASVLENCDAILGSVREVLAGMTQIAAAAEEASGAAAQSSTAARQQASGAEDLAAAIEDIASLADELRAAES
jgi:methyl-accepting chemotaxis protein